MFRIFVTKQSSLFLFCVLSRHTRKTCRDQNKRKSLQDSQRELNVSSFAKIHPVYIRIYPWAGRTTESPEGAFHLTVLSAPSSIGALFRRNIPLKTAAARSKKAFRKKGFFGLYRGFPPLGTSQLHYDSILPFECSCRSASAGSGVRHTQVILCYTVLHPARSPQPKRHRVFSAYLFTILRAQIALYPSTKKLSELVIFPEKTALEWEDILQCTPTRKQGGRSDALFSVLIPPM